MEPRIVVTPGDPRGIGPEVALGALRALEERSSPVGVELVGPDGPLHPSRLDELASEAGTLADTDADAGSFAARSIERAVEMARRGRAHAIVTGPLHKPSLRAAGWSVPGQTEMLAQLTGAESVGMLMAAERTRVDVPLRVLLATTHLALREVASSVTSDLLVSQATLLWRSLKSDWGFTSPAIALCALNPHASDGGLFGDEEERVFEPAVSRLYDLGIPATGPLPADTVFSRALRGEFDAVVAPYHDVGMAAFKTVAFGTGVNVTLGLPFVRTSPDHGTAFDIAGSGTADPSSMLEAIELGRRLAKNRFDTPEADV